MQNPQPKSVADKIAAASRVLITVSNNPSVDQLTASMALALMLHKRDVKTSLVYSGKMPSSIKFLDSNNLVERTVDSLRDFIIMVHKDKASKFRYKEEDDFVKIYVTPNKGKVDKNDLVFEQGDFNVDTVICVGVSKTEDIDNAISKHGRILHNASIISINFGDHAGNIGTTNWLNPNAVTLGEMVHQLGENLGKDVIDDHIANILLTGIISATNHFKSQNTSPNVMSVASKLMMLGANQAKIAAELDRPPLQQKSDHKPQPKSSSHPGKSGRKRDRGPRHGDQNPGHDKPKPDSEHHNKVSSNHKVGALTDDDHKNAHSIREPKPSDQNSVSFNAGSKQALQGADLSQLHAQQHNKSDEPSAKPVDESSPDSALEKVAQAAGEASPVAPIEPKPDSPTTGISVPDPVAPISPPAAPSPPTPAPTPAPPPMAPPTPTPPPPQPSPASPPPFSPPPAAQLPNIQPPSFNNAPSPPTPAPTPPPISPPAAPSPPTPAPTPTPPPMAPPTPTPPPPQPNTPQPAPAPSDESNPAKALEDARMAVERAMSGQAPSPPTPAPTPPPISPPAAPSPPTPAPTPTPPPMAPPTPTPPPPQAPPSGPAPQFTVPQSNYGNYAPPTQQPAPSDWIRDRQSPANLGVAMPNGGTPPTPPPQ